MEIAPEIKHRPTHDYVSVSCCDFGSSLARSIGCCTHGSDIGLRAKEVLEASAAANNSASNPYPSSQRQYKTTTAKLSPWPLRAP